MFPPSLALRALTLLATLPALASAAVVLSTNFSGITVSANTTRGATWTAADPSTVAIAPNATTIGGTTFATSGWVYTFGGDYTTADSARSTGVGQVQFNSVNTGRSSSTAPLDVAVISLAFTVASQNVLNIDQVTMVLGTATTGGLPYTSSLTGGMGAYNIRLTDGTTTHLFHATPVALDTAGGTNSLTTTIAVPSSPISLGAGAWRLDILHSGKPSSNNGSQRTTLDSFALEGTVVAVPEPASIAFLAAGATLGAMALRRRRR